MPEGPDIGWMERLFNYGLPAVLLVLFVVLAWRGARPVLERLVEGHLHFLDSVVEQLQKLGDSLKGLGDTLKRIAESQDKTRSVLEQMEGRLDRIERRSDGRSRD